MRKAVFSYAPFAHFVSPRSRQAPRQACVWPPARLALVSWSWCSVVLVVLVGSCARVRFGWSSACSCCAFVGVVVVVGGLVGRGRLGCVAWLVGVAVVGFRLLVCALVFLILMDVFAHSLNSNVRAFSLIVQIERAADSTNKTITLELPSFVPTLFPPLSSLIVQTERAGNFTNKTATLELPSFVPAHFGHRNATHAQNL